jgi:hypothetical protein
MAQVGRMINFIEVEKGTRNDFNYYNIALYMNDGIEIV